MPNWLKASAAPQCRSDLIEHVNLLLAPNFAVTKSGIDVLGAFAQKAELARVKAAETANRGNGLRNDFGIGHGDPPPSQVPPHI